MEWLTTKHVPEFTDTPGDWSDRRGNSNDRPALAIGTEPGVIVEGESAAEIAAWLRRTADRIDPSTQRRDTTPIGTFVTSIHDDSPTPRVGQVVAIEAFDERGEPEWLAVVWDTDDQPPIRTREAMDELVPKPRQLPAWWPQIPEGR